MKKENIEGVTNCECKRCGFKWFSTSLAKFGKPPKICSVCKSKRWQEKRH